MKKKVVIRAYQLPLPLIETNSTESHESICTTVAIAPCTSAKTTAVVHSIVDIIRTREQEESGRKSDKFLEKIVERAKKAKW
jgi:hypothetical protein